MDEGEGQVESHVRVRHKKTTAFVSVDIAGGATGAILKALTAAAFSLESGESVRLYFLPTRVESDCDDDDEGNGTPVELKSDVPLSNQGICIDDRLVVCTRLSSGDWEPLDDSLLDAVELAAGRGDHA